MSSTICEITDLAMQTSILRAKTTGQFIGEKITVSPKIMDASVFLQFLECFYFHNIKMKIVKNWKFS